MKIKAVFTICTNDEILVTWSNPSGNADDAFAITEAGRDVIKFHIHAGGNLWYENERDFNKWYSGIFSKPNDYQWHSAFLCVNFLDDDGKNVNLANLLDFINLEDLNKIKSVFEMANEAMNEAMNVALAKAEQDEDNVTSINEKEND